MATIGKLVGEASEGLSLFEGFSLRCTWACSTRLRRLLFFGALGMNHPGSADKYRDRVYAGQF
jgi:hypothetical protein